MAAKFPNRVARNMIPDRVRRNISRAVCEAAMFKFSDVSLDLLAIKVGLMILDELID